MRHAITRANGGLVYSRIYVPLVLDELNKTVFWQKMYGVSFYRILLVLSQNCKFGQNPQ